tara:strand:+ start:118 stop:354 length:237 start_codon:yes stop_codon:yes gene_type:complete
MHSDELNGINEIQSIIEYEIKKIEKAIINIKNNPKPDIEYLVMPERMRCYKDGLKYTKKIIDKYKKFEGIMDDDTENS